MAPIACFFERESKINGHIICLLFFSALVGATLTQYLYLVGLKYTSATFASAFLNTVPVFTFILALPMGMEKMSMKSKSGKAKILGTFVCIGGALVLVLYKGMPIINPQSHNIAGKAITPEPASSLKKWIMGSIFLTVGCVFWSSWFLIQERIGKKYPYRYSSTAIISLFAAIQSAILNLIIHRNNAKWILKGKLQIMTVVYSGLVGSGLCYVAMAWCVKQKGPVFTAAFTPLIQMFVAVLDLCILQEEIYLGRLVGSYHSYFSTFYIAFSLITFLSAISSVVGSVLVISGMYMLLWGKSKEREQCALKDTQENQKDEECH